MRPCANAVNQTRSAPGHNIDLDGSTGPDGYVELGDDYRNGSPGAGICLHRHRFVGGIDDVVPLRQDDDRHWWHAAQVHPESHSDLRILHKGWVDRIFSTSGSNGNQYWRVRVQARMWTISSRIEAPRLAPRKHGNVSLPRRSRDYVLFVEQLAVDERERAGAGVAQL